MKLPGVNSKMWRGARAFTLVEALITSATLVILIGSVIMCNLFGLSMAARQQIWLGASDDSAQAISTLMGNIRSATGLCVGGYYNGIFTNVPNFVPQTGNALYVTNAGTSNTVISLYYYDSVNNYLMLTNYSTAGGAGIFKKVSVNPVTNDVTHPIFSEVTCSNSGGNLVITPLTVTTPLASISIYLSFTALQNSQVPIAAGSQVDLYQVMPVVTPRLHL